MDDQLQRICALSDACALTSLMLDFKHLREACQAIHIGAIQQDMNEIATELDRSIEGSVADRLAPLMSVDPDEMYLAVRREHTRLFDDPDMPACPYYEGAFLNRQYRKQGREAPDEDLLFVNLAANDADRQYKRAGFVRAKEQNIPGDCMITEMAFVAQLLMSVAEGLQKPGQNSSCGEDVSPDATQQNVFEFLRLHFRPWAEDFFSSLIEESQTAYFQAVGQWGLFCVAQLRLMEPTAFEKGKKHGAVA